jgi:septum site-determining protein MinC
VVVSTDAGNGSSFRFDGRSFVGLTLSPKTPFDDWLIALDGWIARSWIFTSRPIIIDFAKATPTRSQALELLSQIKARGLRVVAVDGVEQEWLNETNRPTPAGGSADRNEALKSGQATGQSPARIHAGSERSPDNSSGLLVELPVRSGQTIVHPNGDVTVLGSIASGAEVVAGGSIHIYGALRGRAIAGNGNNPKARLFCRHFEPELVAINGLYCTAEEVDPALLKHPVQAWLEGNTINMSIME